LGGSVATRLARHADGAREFGRAEPQSA
jgi:hypothetical protein